MNYKIKLNKYKSSVFTKSKLNILNEKSPSICTSKDISISDVKLTYDTAKAMLTTVSKYNPSTVGYARSYFQIIPYLLSEKNGYWAWDKDNLELLRDFSKSSRSGELAQGINYYLSLSELDAYYIWDYKQFVKEKIGPKTGMKGRLPDYVLEYRDGTYGILEVKGTNKKNPTEALLSAKKQYENGKVILNSNGINVRDTYASAVSFATTSKRMKRETTIYLVDPFEDGKIDDKMDFKAGIMRECSKHLCLAGNVELANIFKKGIISTCENTESDDNNFDKLRSTGSFKIINGDNKVIEFEMGFTDRLINYLDSDNNKPIMFEEYVKDDCEYFIDGTYIKMRKYKLNS